MPDESKIKLGVSAATTGSDLRVDWFAPSNVVLPTDIKVTVPELKPGHYSIPGGWLDVR